MGNRDTGQEADYDNQADAESGNPVQRHHYHARNRYSTGGILSPLLANVVLNELDWWIAGQWEMFKIREGKTGLEFNKTDKEGNVLTVDRTQKWNKLRAKTELKEMYIVRYADDFKILCRDYATAKKVMCATKLWLAENLHLQTSDEKSGITNLQKNYTTFLGIKFKVVPKGSKWIIHSHMCLHVSVEYIFYIIIPAVSPIIYNAPVFSV